MISFYSLGLVSPVDVYMVPACQSMHFHTVVNACRDMGESSVMKRKSCLTPASPSGVNMENAGFPALGNHIANAAADTLGIAVIKVNNSACYHYLVLEHEQSKHCQFFFTIHICVAFFLNTS